jgi:hypothetical protein
MLYDTREGLEMSLGAMQIGGKKGRVWSSLHLKGDGDCNSHKDTADGPCYDMLLKHTCCQLRRRQSNYRNQR